MKPILIYTMPRSRGTASLYRCKKNDKLNEPFRKALTNDFANNYWHTLVEKMNSNDTCTKIHGYHMEFYPPGKEWYNQVINSHSHNIFVVERKDRMNMLLSDVLAREYGYNYSSEKEKGNKNNMKVTPNIINQITGSVALYLKYFPCHGKVITYETLPDSYFDLTTEIGNHKDQQSYLKHHRIINLEQCKKELQNILDFYKKEWDDKILSLDPNWKF